ncbi:Kinase, AGC NDR [Spironucleus salmonicida]|uniref:non-specific serine/threonine protein kinase n=1 Tax=Spironucleus salmonicida TaxID=348837 RepID=V6LS93_9EUKA|nr:Kinase, AGC NDR [Spironucleus salmonicida]|eukprot:EST43649.1 Kinase, AGC NDR [Spironucleus salmonicida]
MTESIIFKGYIHEWLKQQKLFLKDKETRLNDILSYECEQYVKDDLIQITIARETLLLRSKRVGVTTSDFQIIKQIGKGSYSIVYLVLHIQTGKIYAMKVISKQKISNPQDGVRIRTERTVMLNFQSPFVVKLYYAFQTDNDLYFVMDYASGSDFSNLLDQCGALPLSWTRFYFAEMLSGVLTLHGTDVSKILNFNQVEFIKQLHSAQSFTDDPNSCVSTTKSDSNRSYVHEIEQIRKSRLSQAAFDSESYIIDRKNNLALTFCDIADSQSQVSDIIEEDASNKQQLEFSTIINNQQSFIHRDLKPQNFLLSDTGHVMLADFGFAKELIETNQSEQSIYYFDEGTNNIVGSLNYMSPEQFRQNIYGKFIDFWALGCILYEMLTGEQAVNAETQEQLIQNLTLNTYQSFIPAQLDIPDDAYDLITQLLSSPDKRLGRSFNLEQLLTHKFFTLGVPLHDIINFQNNSIKLIVQQQQANSPHIYDDVPIIPYYNLLMNIQPPWKPTADPDFETITTTVKSGQISINAECMRSNRQGSTLNMVQKYIDEDELDISESSNDFVKSIYDDKDQFQVEKISQFKLNICAAQIQQSIPIKQQTSFVGLDYTGLAWDDAQDTTPRLHIFDKKINIEEQ